MAGLLTLREFAELHGIKKPTVNARLKRIERNNPDKTLTKKTGNLIYLTDAGRELLEKSFKETPVKTAQIKKKRGNASPVKENKGELIKLYENEISRLENDLAASRRENERLLNQIDELTALISQLTGAVSSALTDSQRLISQEQSLAMVDKKTAEFQEKPENKKRFLSRLAVAGRVLLGEYD